MGNRGMRGALIATTAIYAVAVASPALAQSKSFNVPAQPASTGIPELARQADVQILVAESAARGKTIKAIKGTMSVDQALRRALSGTGLRVSSSDGRTFTLVGNGRADPAPQVTASPVVGDASEDDGQDIVVTGTQIRGQAPIGAQVTTIDRKEMERRGFTTISDAVRSLNQVANLGPTEVALSSNTQFSAQNLGRGSGINLRGLGPDATLVLLNGRRLAGSGLGAFVDISLIPLAALERVEVLTDGASAIYGSDAVGGVVNVITRGRIKGIHAEGDAGFADSYRTQRAAIATGADWGTGGIAVTGEYRRSSDLKGIDRSFFHMSPTSRSTFCTPGAITASGVTYAIPAGLNGAVPAPASLTQGAVSCDTAPQNDIAPESERWSATGHIEQGIGDWLTVFADGLYSDKTSSTTSVATSVSLSIPRGSPYFVNINPTAASITLTKNVFDDLGPVETSAEAEQVAIAGGFRANISPAWQVEGFVNYSAAKDRQLQDNAVNTFYLNRAVLATDPVISYNPFGNTPVGVLNEIRGYSRTYARSFDTTIHLGVTGALGNLFGAGDVRLAIGAETREQEYHLDTVTYRSTAAPVNGTPTRNDRRVNSAYAELSLPIVGPDAKIPGMRKLLVSAAVRHDDYRGVGATTNPKFGVEWNIAGPVSLVSSWGRSFKAPLLSTLTDRFSATVVSVPDPTSSTGRTNLLATSGPLPAPLQPERAEAFTAGLKVAETTDLPLSLQINYFHVRYSDRITSFNTIIATALTQEAIYGSLITRNPSAAQVAVIANNPYLIAPFTVPAAGVGAILNYAARNVSSVTINGLDASIAYKLATSAGDFRFSVNATRNFHYETQLLSTTPLVDQLNDITFPSKWKGNASIGYQRGAVNATFVGNYIGSYNNTGVVGGQEISSWFTVDATVGVALDFIPAFKERGTLLTLSARNLFDRDPPFVQGPAGYDGFAADPFGRVITLGFRTRF